MQETERTDVFRVKKEGVWVLSEPAYTPHFFFWPCIC